MISLSEFHNYVAHNQSNICQITAIQNEKTIINDTWNGYKVDDTVHTMSVTKSIFFLKKENTGGVLKSPFFKDTAVSGRYRRVLFPFPSP